MVLPNRSDRYLDQTTSYTSAVMPEQKNRSRIILRNCLGQSTTPDRIECFMAIGGLNKHFSSRNGAQAGITAIASMTVFISILFQRFVFLLRNGCLTWV